MEPARTVIERFGGEAKVAEVTGASMTAPYRWTYPRDRGGTGGNIPQKHHRALLEYAKQNDIELSAEDLLPVNEETAA